MSQHYKLDMSKHTIPWHVKPFLLFCKTRFSFTSLENGIYHLVYFKKYKGKIYITGDEQLNIEDMKRKNLKWN